MLSRVLNKLKALLGRGNTAQQYSYHIDVSFNHVVKGWAYNLAHPNKPVHVAFKSEGRVFCEVYANKERSDLQSAGLPSHTCAFELAPDLPQRTVTPVLADLFLDGVRVNNAPIVFSIDIEKLVALIKKEPVKHKN
ncbi:hypothetical protein [Vibrio atypicus]|uniref:hypothetical protein n=1 Tax=Vibrio atypicus TaxID=558271 RepID=UPI00135B3E5F|nr:hypothetical protein [Vibrio atypicus]